MKKSQILAMASLVALGLSGCAKSDDGKAALVDGSKATVSLSFTLPSSATKVGATQAALPQESAVTTADVFVFNPDGTKADAGAYSAFAVTAANFFVSGDTYTLLDDKAIETLSGSHHIYVGLNLPSAARGEYPTESDLLAAVASVAGMSVAGNFTMFSDRTISDLQGHEYNGGTEAAPYINTVSMTVDRVVAKVVGSTNNATYTVEWPEVPDFNMVYTIKGFRVIQDAVKSYVAPNHSVGKPHTLIDEATATGVLSDFATGAAAALISMPNPHPATEAELNSLTGVYAGENAPAVNLNGNTTYAMVATTVVISHKAIWDAALNSGEGGVTWEEVTSGYGGGTSDVLLVNYEGLDYPTASLAEASAIKAGLDAIDNVTPKVATIYTYPKGWVHFPVYLNKAAANDYSVLRNQFVHLKVNGVTGNNNFFPGYPGDPTNPDRPTDPTSPTDPNNPNPTDPTKPIDPMPASLVVDVTVNPWLYSANDVLLK